MSKQNVSAGENSPWYVGRNDTLISDVQVPEWIEKGGDVVSIEVLTDERWYGRVEIIRFALEEGRDNEGKPVYGPIRTHINTAGTMSMDSTTTAALAQLLLGHAVHGVDVACYNKVVKPEPTAEPLTSCKASTGNLNLSEYWRPRPSGDGFFIAFEPAAPVTATFTMAESEEAWLERKKACVEHREGRVLLTWTAVGSSRLKTSGKTQKEAVRSAREIESKLLTV